MSDLLDFAEQIESWHSHKVSNLQKVIENIKEGVTLKIGENGEEVELDKKQALLFKFGLVSALGEFEELPFKLTKNEHDKTCPSCGSTPEEYTGELVNCKFCSALKCSICDMGNDVSCMSCEGE